MSLGYFSECNIVGFVCAEKGVMNLAGKLVYDKSDLIREQEKIVMTDNIPLEPYRTYYKRLKDISSELYSVLEKTPYILVKKMN